MRRQLAESYSATYNATINLDPAASDDTTIEFNIGGSATHGDDYSISGGVTNRSGSVDAAAT